MRGITKAGLMIGAVTLGAAVALLVGPDRTARTARTGGGAADAATGERGDDPHPAVEHFAVEVREPATPSAEHAPRAIVDVSSPAAGPGSSVDDGRVAFRGTVVVLDGEERIEGLDGTLAIGVEPQTTEWVAPRRDEVALTVEDGRFRACVVRGARVRAHTARLAGRSVAMEGVVHHADRDAEVELRGSVADLLLHVVDAETGEDLPDVTIVRLVPDSPAALGHSLVRPPLGGPTTSVRDRAASPVLLAPSELPMPMSHAPWFVRTAGYGWLPYVAPDDLRWEHRLELRREATLTVRVTGLPRTLRTVLRARADDVERGAL